MKMKKSQSFEKTRCSSEKDGYVYNNDLNIQTTKKLDFDI
jgi:hypothetical protein